SRRPDRTIGLLLRVPVSVVDLTAADALAVPAVVMQAELDAVVDNAAVRSTFEQNRARGGLWSLALEPDLPHNVATGAGNQAVSQWINTALTRRLPATLGDPLIAIDAESGWLGNNTTLEIAAWANYTGDRTTASWLLSATVANTWKLLATGEDTS